MLVKLSALDQMKQEQIAWMFEVRTHPEVHQHFFAPAPKHFQEHVQYLEKVIRNKSRQFFIVYAEDQKAGYCQIAHLSDTYEVGFSLHPSFWGKGIGKKIVKLLLEHIRNNLAPKKVILFVRKSNERAMYLYEKAGFRTIETENDRCKMELMAEADENPVLV